MPVYIVTDKADGEEVYRYEAVAPIEFPGMAFGTHNHTEAQEPPAPPSPPRKITRLAFMNRFTDAEAVGIDLASMGATVQAAGIRRHLKKVDAAEHIDLTRQETRDGVIAMEAGGLIGPGRALTILDAPIQEHEVSRG